MSELINDPFNQKNLIWGLRGDDSLVVLLLLIGVMLLGLFIGAKSSKNMVQYIYIFCVFI